MAEVWVGQLELGAAMRSERMRVNGPEHLVRSMPDWLGLSSSPTRTRPPSSPGVRARAAGPRVNIPSTL